MTQLQNYKSSISHHSSRCNIFVDNQREENECETNIAERNNADYVMETFGSGKHGIMENDQETIQGYESSPAANAEELQSSSDEENDL